MSDSSFKLGPIAIVILVVCTTVFSWAAYREYNIDQGRKAFAHYGCAQCHASGGAPDLTKVKNKYDRQTISRFIQDPEQIYREKGRRPLNPEFFPMPQLHVSPREADQLVAFITAAD